MRRLLVIALVLLVPSATRAAEDRPSRVLARVQRAVHAPQTPHLNSLNVLQTSIEKKDVPDAGRTLRVPVLPPGCGMSQPGGLDVERTLALATDLFSLYGFDLEPDLLAGNVRLDLLDRTAKVGVLVLPPAVGGAREPARDVDRAALRALVRDGYRVLVLPLPRFSVMQNDTSTPLHAAALSIVDFLDDITDGADADVAALGGGHRFELSLEGLEECETGPIQASGDSAFFVLEERVTVTLEAEGHPRAGAPARPSLVVLPFYWVPPMEKDGTGYDFEAKKPTFELLQSGMEPLESGRALFLTEPNFDPSKPFRIRVSLQPGQVYLGRTVTVQLAD